VPLQSRHRGLLTANRSQDIGAIVRFPWENTALFIFTQSTHDVVTTGPVSYQAKTAHDVVTIEANLLNALLCNGLTLLDRCGIVFP
jgi:hypothetical protein